MSELIKISELIEDYRSLYGSGDWSETTAELLNYDFATIDLLRQELRLKGRFREPIHLSNNGKEKYVSDGARRIIAAQLESLSELEATFGMSEDQDEYDHVIESKITLRDDYSDDNFEEVSEVCRSFPVNEDLWVTAFATIGSKNEIVIVWDILDPFKADLINEKLEEILKEFKVKSVVTYFKEVEDEDVL